MLVFIDESGDSGIQSKPGSSKYFIVTAVIFQDNEEAYDCEKRIVQCRKELKLSEHFEFHFNKCCDRFRERFLSAVCPSEFFYHSFVLNKAKLWGKGFQDKDSFYKYAIGIVFSNARELLQNSTVIIDECGDRQFRDRLTKYLRRKMNEPGNRLIKHVKMERADSNNLLQLADMVCGAVARSFNVGKQERMAFRNIIRHREIRVQLWPK